MKKGKIKFEKNAPSALKGEFVGNLAWMNADENDTSLITLEDKMRDDCASLLKASIDQKRKELQFTGFDNDFEVDRYFTEQDQMDDPDLSSYISKEIGREILFPSKITSWLTEDQLKLLYITSARIDITNNIHKCNMIRYILGPTFREVGAGTNRIAFRKFNHILKIALDPRGVIDNMIEFCRSQDFEEYLAKTYETNSISNVQEYVKLCSADEFMSMEFQLAAKNILEEITKTHMMDDVCLGSKKNYTNWGYRILLEDDMSKNWLKNKHIVIVDYGYCYDMRYSPEIMRCSVCGEPLVYNKDFTALVCTNPNKSNRHMVQVSDKRDEMSREMENREIKAIYDMTNIKLPTIDDFSQFLYNKKMKSEDRDLIEHVVEKTFGGLSDYIKGGGMQ
jgi:hypothetical protein